MIGPKAAERLFGRGKIQWCLGAAFGILFVRGIVSVLPEESVYTSLHMLGPLTATVLTGTLVGVRIVAELIPAIRDAQIRPAEALRAIELRGHSPVNEPDHAHQSDQSQHLRHGLGYADHV